MQKAVILAANSENIALMKQELLSGEVAAFPTETVYGLGANAFDERAVAKIFEAKGRPQDNPLIVHISDWDMIYQVAREVNQTAQKLAAAFWGGPLTMILPKNPKIPPIVSAGLDTVGIRMPSHPDAIALIRACGVPIAAPSANASGKPSPTKASHVYFDLKHKIRYILDGGECQVGVESTVVRVLDDMVEVLRPGGITVDDLLQVVSTVKIDDGVFFKVGDDVKVASPGMRYQHYAPNAHVVMIKSDLSDFCKYVSKHAPENAGVLVFDGEETLFDIPCITYGEKQDACGQASHLFDALRQIDQLGLQKVFARVPSRDGVGLAVYNRLLRACGFDVVDLYQKVTILGLTGQSGSGKTTICKAFREEGVAVIDCDLVSRDVIQQPDVMEKLVAYYGEQILNHDGSLNRKVLAGLVFGEEEKRIHLNSIMYPKITQELKRQIQSLSKENYDIIVLDAPTLFESGADQMCDLIISAVSPLEVRRKRIMERDHLTFDQAQARISAQYDDQFYQSRSHYVITNTGDLAQLTEHSKQLIRRIRGEICHQIN